MDLKSIIYKTLIGGICLYGGKKLYSYYLDRNEIKEPIRLSSLHKNMIVYIKKFPHLFNYELYKEVFNELGISKEEYDSKKSSEELNETNTSEVNTNVSEVNTNLTQ